MISTVLKFSALKWELLWCKSRIDIQLVQTYGFILFPLNILFVVIRCREYFNWGIKHWSSKLKLATLDFSPIFYLIFSSVQWNTNENKFLRILNFVFMDFQFDVYWIQSNRQTDIQSIYIYIEGGQSIIKFMQCNFIYSYFLFIPFSDHDYSFS